VGSDQGSCRVLLEGANLKLLSAHVYALIGRNGCGKSSLLRRIAAGRIPGFPPHISTLYISQEVLLDEQEADRENLTPLDMVLREHGTYSNKAAAAAQSHMEELEADMDLLDVTLEEDQVKMEELCDRLSLLADDADGAHDMRAVEKEALEALEFMGIDESLCHAPITSLSAGLRKKVCLAVALSCRCDVLLLDEPTNHLDVQGLIQLRRLIALCTARQTTVLLVSHDVDLINDVATDAIQQFDQFLLYYPGNYADYLVVREQSDLHQQRQAVALDRKKVSMEKTIDNLKKNAGPKGGHATKKKNKQIESRKKQMERQGLDGKDEKGHRSGTTQQQTDKAVQFAFRKVTSQWGEPLIMALDVGHGYGVTTDSPPSELAEDEPAPVRGILKDGFLFDCVDLCIDEGGTYCIMGANASGKSVLLRILAKLEEPLEGDVKHAVNLDVGFYDQNVVDLMIQQNGAGTALTYLTERFPKKNEQDIRSELAAFGLSPMQVQTNLSFLSGGERSRLCLTALMLGDPQVLVLDNPTSNLDVESVEALIYGLGKWNGTVVIVSHDANFIRSLEAKCCVLSPREGKLLRVQGGIDAYLKAFTH
jgi:ATPase subunit of ABC transporter with duplicated ATPase domains